MDRGLLGSVWQEGVSNGKSIGFCPRTEEHFPTRAPWRTGPEMIPKTQGKALFSALWKTEPGAKLKCFILDTIPGQSDEGKWKQGRIGEKQSVGETWFFAQSHEMFLAGHKEHSQLRVPQREEGRFFYL